MKSRVRRVACKFVGGGQFRKQALLTLLSCQVPPTSARRRITSQRTRVTREVQRRQNGRQTPHATTARVTAEQVHRHRPRRHYQARVDIKHRPRLIRQLPRASSASPLHGDRHGNADGEGQNALYGKDGAALWASARDGRMRRMTWKVVQIRRVISRLEVTSGMRRPMEMETTFSGHEDVSLALHCREIRDPRNEPELLHTRVLQVLRQHAVLHYRRAR